MTAKCRNVGTSDTAPRSGTLRVLSLYLSMQVRASRLAGSASPRATVAVGTFRRSDNRQVVR